MGGVEEMRGVVGHRAHSFGLLRMTFGVGAEARTKFICVHASEPIDSGKFSQLEHGRALANKPVMVKAIRDFTACATDIHIQSQEECTVEHVVNTLCDVVRGVEAKLITVESFKAAVTQHMEQHPEVRMLEEERQEQVRFLESVKAPRVEAVPPECERSQRLEGFTRLRKKVKLYSKGDMVEFWSTVQNQWMLDGEIVHVVAESCVDSGVHITAGSSLVAHSSGTRFEWLVPQMV